MKNKILNTKRGKIKNKENLKHRLEKMEEEYTLMVQQWKAMGQKVKDASKALAVMVQTLRTMDELLLNNFNLWVRYERVGKNRRCVAKMSTFKNELDVKREISADNFQGLLVSIAKSKDGFMSGAADLTEMVLDQFNLTDEEKEAILKGGKRLLI